MLTLVEIYRLNRLYFNKIRSIWYLKNESKITPNLRLQSPVPQWLRRICCLNQYFMGAVDNCEVIQEITTHLCMNRDPKLTLSCFRLRAG